MKKSVIKKPVRKTAAKKATVKKNAVVNTETSVTVQQDDTSKSPKVLAAFPLQDIMGWRDSARKRLNSRAVRMEKLRAQHEAIIREANKLDLQQHSDLL